MSLSVNSIISVIMGLLLSTDFLFFMDHFSCPFFKKKNSYCLEREDNVETVTEGKKRFTDVHCGSKKMATNFPPLEFGLTLVA